MLITAAAVVSNGADFGQLVPVLEQAEEMTGVRAPVTLGDGGQSGRVAGPGRKTANAGG